MNLKASSFYCFSIFYYHSEKQYRLKYLFGQKIIRTFWKCAQATAWDAACCGEGRPVPTLQRFSIDLGGSRQPFPAVFRQAIALCRHRQSRVYSLFFLELFFLPQEQSVCINMFSFQPDEYVTFQQMSVKSVKFSWHVKMKFSLSS